MAACATCSVVSRPTRSWESRRLSTRSTARTSRRRSICGGFRPGVTGSSMGPARMPGSLTSATVGWRPSRWRATTTRVSSSPIRAQPQAWAESCVTSSRWGRGRSPASTRCVSATSTARAARGCGTSSTAWCVASATTATVSAFRRLEARPASTVPATATSWSTPLRWESVVGSGSSPRSLQGPGTRFSTPAAEPVATAFMAPRWLRRPSTARARPSGPPCRSATRSPRRCCSKRVSTRCAAGSYSACRTWAPPA